LAEEAVAIGNGATLRVIQRLVSDNDLAAFWEGLEEGQVRPKALGAGDSLPVPIKATRQIIAPVLGHAAATCRCHCTLPNLYEIFGPEPENALPSVLQALDTTLNFGFARAAAHRLGNVEILELREWLEQPLPFLCQSVRPKDGVDDGTPRHFELCRSPEFAAAHHIAHLVCRSGKDVILDRLVNLPHGCLRSDAIVSPGPVDEYELRLFDAQGGLLHKEGFPFLRTITTNMAMQGRKVEIQDRLTERAASQGKDKEKRAATVSSYASQRFQVGGHDAARLYADAVHSLLPVKDHSEDRWFNRGLGDELDVIEYFRELTHGGRVARAVIVDPFFDVESVRRLVLRLDNRDLGLTIVTSWQRHQAQELVSALSAAREVINASVTLLNLTVSGREKAFHDRYALMYPHEARPHVFLLSNSLNAMAKDWPFCLSRLSGEAEVLARKYIEGLCRGEDITGGQPPNLTTLWPLP